VAVRLSSKVVEARGLGLTFQTNDGPVQALSNVDLSIGKGEFVSFIGPSGCGKTTFLRVIADLERPTQGTISVNGMTPQQAREARAYGYVFQAAALLPWRTIEKNIALPLEIMGVPAGEQATRIARVTDLVNLTGLREEISLAAFRRHAAARLDRARARFRRRPAADGRAFGALDEIVRDHLNKQLLSSGPAPTRRSASSRIRSPRPSIYRPASS
jgi:NitT/TauT family transport system ATP-binding protein